MKISRCAAQCNGRCHSIDRRLFLQAAAGFALAPALLGGCASSPQANIGPRIRACGPASKYTPVIHAAFVRRKEDYGILWPGDIYDGKGAYARYTADIEKTAKAIGAKVILRPEPIYSLAEADAWIAEAKQAQSDGLFLVVHDRQKHAWPTAAKAADSGLPAVIFTATFATVGAFYVQTRAQRFTSPTHTALIFALEPVFAALFATMLGGERLNMPESLGCALILAGMLTAQLERA